MASLCRVLPSRLYFNIISISVSNPLLRLLLFPLLLLRQAAKIYLSSRLLLTIAVWTGDRHVPFPAFLRYLYAMDSKILDRHKATVSNLLKIYDGIEPLHLYLKKYFAENKKHGSRDRKAITGLCYGYFRLGQNAQRLQKNHPDGPALSVSKVLDIAGYITGILPYPPFLEENMGKDNMTASLVPEPLPMDRFNAIARHYDCLNQDALFPFDAATSPDLDLPDFRASMLSQPRLFIRMRPQKGTHTHSEVMRVLGSGEIAFFPWTRTYSAWLPIRRWIRFYV